MSVSTRWPAVRRALRTTAIRGGASLGRPGARYFNRVTLASHLRHLFKQLDVNCVLDIGAHQGEYAEFLRSSVGYRGRIVSFEPTPQSFDALATRFGHDPDWVGQGFALGSIDSSAQLHILQNSVFNSFLLPTPQAEANFAGQVRREGDVTVPVHRLDARFGECVAGLADPHVFMKMDTQGYDVEVFRGAGDCLTSVVGLQSELSLVPLYRETPDYLESLAEYAAAGYVPSGIYTVNRDEGGLRLLEVDAVLVRGPAAARP